MNKYQEVSKILHPCGYSYGTGLVLAKNWQGLINSGGTLACYIEKIPPIPTDLNKTISSLCNASRKTKKAQFLHASIS